MGMYPSVINKLLAISALFELLVYLDRMTTVIINSSVRPCPGQTAQKEADCPLPPAMRYLKKSNTLKLVFCLWNLTTDRSGKR